MKITNLAGVFTGEGFKNKFGRRPEFEDCGYLQGPLDIQISDEGKIVSIKKSHHGAAENAQQGSREINGEGLVATAGFVDSHTHSIFLGSRAPEYFQRWSGLSYKEISDRGGGIHNTVSVTENAGEDELLAALKHHLQASMKSGVTCIEVKTGYASTAAGELKLLSVLKKFKELYGSRKTSGYLSYPKILVTFLGLHALPKGSGENDFVDSMVAILPVIAKEKLADFIDAFPEKGFFSLESSKRFSDAALSFGLKAKIHSDELSDLGTTATYAQSGALSVDHLQEISEAGVVALSGSSTVATLLPATSFYLDLKYTNARRLIDAGARVALATDFNPGTAPNPSFSFTQLLAASKLKMNAAEILCASTFNAAAAVGRDSEVGVLAPGYLAHLNLFEIKHGESAEAVLSRVFVESLSPVKTLVF
jgi:imidazolonepropionase